MEALTQALALDFLSALDEPQSVPLGWVRDRLLVDKRTMVVTFPLHFFSRLGLGSAEAFAEAFRSDLVSTCFLDKKRMVFALAHAPLVRRAFLFPASFSRGHESKEAYVEHTSVPYGLDRKHLPVRMLRSALLGGWAVRALRQRGYRVRSEVFVGRTINADDEQEGLASVRADLKSMGVEADAITNHTEPPVDCSPLLERMKTLHPFPDGSLLFESPGLNVLLLRSGALPTASLRRAQLAFDRMQTADVGIFCSGDAGSNFHLPFQEFAPPDMVARTVFVRPGEVHRSRSRYLPRPYLWKNLLEHVSDSLSVKGVKDVPEASLPYLCRVILICSALSVGPKKDLYLWTDCAWQSLEGYHLLTTIHSIQQFRLEFPLPSDHLAVGPEDASAAKLALYMLDVVESLDDAITTMQPQRFVASVMSLVREAKNTARCREWLSSPWRIKLMHHVGDVLEESLFLLCGPK